MKNSKVLLILFFISFSSIVNGQVNYEPDSTFIYKTTEEGPLKMNVFTPSNHNVSDKRPVIIFFFGGGWASGQPKQFYQQARFFADKGFLAVSAEYRVIKKHKTTPFECVKDGKSAIRYIRKHAVELGIDPDKIIASGGSAGGHVAACAGVIKDFDEVEEDLNISSVPDAMILFNPVMDTTEKGNGIEKVGESRKTEISPCHHVESGIPLTLIFHGTSDKTVPFENVERFTKLMNEAGNNCQLIPFEGKDHGFFNGSYFRKRNTDNFFNILMEASLVFLNEYNFKP